MRLRPVLAGIVLLIALPAAPRAAVMEARADVLDVQPITSEGERRCDVPPPSTQLTLGERLAWDLQQRCRDLGGGTVLGYRVHYEWDGRRFTTVLDEPPEDGTLPIRLTVD